MANVSEFSIVLRAEKGGPSPTRGSSDMSIIRSTDRGLSLCASTVPFLVQSRLHLPTVKTAHTRSSRLFRIAHFRGFNTSFRRALFEPLAA